jgi:putative lipoprotein
MLLALGPALPACSATPPAPAPNMQTLSGTVTTRVRMAIPPDAEIRVALIEIPGGSAPATVFAETRFAAGGRQVPLPFSLAYDAARVEPGRSYALTADIRVRDRIVFRTTGPHPALARDAPTTGIVLPLEPMLSTQPGG